MAGPGAPANLTFSAWLAALPHFLFKRQEKVFFERLPPQNSVHRNAAIYL